MRNRYVIKGVVAEKLEKWIGDFLNLFRKTVSPLLITFSFHLPPTIVQTLIRYVVISHFSCFILLSTGTIQPPSAVVM